MTVSPAEAISGPLYKPPPCAPLYIFLHLCRDRSLPHSQNILVNGQVAAAGQLGHLHLNHRPVWPKFGEYQFVPAQRWLHNIEHGAVVMLYHPCTHPHTVQTLRRLVTGCIRKHIITPHTNIPEDRPLALVAWGCRMLMSEVDENQVIKFIREKGLKGPEVGQ